ncbi:hypothetical protein CDD80_2642 [Ophiocordyceps camponoti-rufipedis]|uniref:Rhodopsin domain-containing protein n=1 Tax=Ophiocordyceps camponoti-rufipedis TaxID=2004952 RepID=A0A2C5Z7D9_9HYPO|nr:hypothetical protein CDD80_2642 [Ophiocordyceps camponoti-rufipedis]
MAAVEAWVYLGICTALVLLRLYARLHSQAGGGVLHLDDHLMALAIPLFVAVVIVAQVIQSETQNLANNDMTPEYRASLDPLSDEFAMRVRGSQLHMAGWTIYVTLLWTLKICWLLLYRRFGERVSHIKLKINLGVVIVASTYLLVIFVVMFACRPIGRNWQISPDPGDSCHPAVSKVQAIITALVNLGTDMYIIWIPLPIILGARISKLDKTILGTMFVACLVITMSVGLARCGLILTNSSGNTEFVGRWSYREAFVAVVISNMPVLFPWTRQKLSRHTKQKDSDAIPEPLRSLSIGSDQTIVVAGGLDSVKADLESGLRHKHHPEGGFDDDDDDDVSPLDARLQEGEAEEGRKGDGHGVVDKGETEERETLPPA